VHSTTASRIARICGAIDELAGRSCEPDGVTATAAQSGDAAETRGATGTTGATGTGGATRIAGATGTGGSAPAGSAGRAKEIDGAPGFGRSAAGDDVADRLAAIWAMIADADPELARRMPGYLAAAD